MLPILVVIFIVVPFVEVAVLFLIADVIGWPLALVLFVALPGFGLLLLRQQGLSSLRRVQAALRQDRLPGRELVDAMLVCVGGLLIAFPGFVTGVVGLTLMIPPARALVRVGLLAILRRRLDRLPKRVVVRLSQEPVEFLPAADIALTAGGTGAPPPAEAEHGSAPSGAGMQRSGQIAGAATGEAGAAAESEFFDAGGQAVPDIEDESDAAAWSSFRVDRGWEEAPERRFFGKRNKKKKDDGE